MPEERGQKPEREIVYVPAPGYTHQDEDEIDLIELWNILWDRKWFIFGFVALCTAVAAIVSLYVLPPQYTARATLQANEESRRTISDYLSSDKLIRDMVSRFHLLPELYPGKWDESQGTWKVREDRIPSAQQLVAQGGFPLEVNTNENKINLAWTGQDPDSCSAMLDRVIRRVRTYLEKELVTDAQIELSIYERKLPELKELLNAALSRSTIAFTSNSDPLVAAVSSYMRIRENMLQIRAENELARAFTVLEEPVPPQSPEKPRPKLIVGLSFVLSLFVAVFLVFFLRFIQSAKQKRRERTS